MYEAHSRRKAVETAFAWKNAMYSGLTANSNLDDDKGTKEQALRSIDDEFQNILVTIYNGEKDEEIDFQKDPFFAAMKLPGDPRLLEPDRTTTTE